MLDTVAMELLAIWLYVVAAMRALSVFMGYFFPQKLCSTVFASAMKYDTSALTGRTFGVWTLVTCTLCILTAQNLDASSPIFLATMLSFVYAFAFFVLEMLVYKTVSTKSIISPGIVSVASMVWMYSVRYH